MHQFHSSILREYDIRGIVPDTLGDQDAYHIGRSFGSVIARTNLNAKIAVGYDGRVSSPILESALVRGLTECGVSVIRIGIGPTPMLYYAVCSLKLDGGIMLTGSHNPPTHNGFKFMRGQKPFFGDDIKQLGPIAAKGDYVSGKGQATNRSVFSDYVEMLLKSFQSGRPLTIAWDAGNGAGGEVARTLCEKLKGTHIPLYCDIDGTFPNHHPDPTVPKNLEPLIGTVRTKKCEAGIAFDGDADRIGVVDDQGEILWGDQLLALYAADVLKHHPGATVIADVKASQSLFDEIKRLGGSPLMWKTGHSHIKSKMQETGAKLAGEMSGHVFFADHYYGYDDGIYAAIRLLNILAATDEPLSKLRARLPKTVATPEIRFDCDESRKFKIIDEVKSRLQKSGATFSDIDGVRVNTADGWWLLRASNTQAVLVARCESSNDAGLERLKAYLASELKLSGLTLPDASDAHA